MTNRCWGLRALILLALDTHQGQWVTLDWLTRRVGARPALLDSVCQELAAANLMTAAVVDGQACFGVRVDASSAVFACEPARGA